MHIAVKALTGLVALLHVSFFVIEAFLWKKPLGRKVFGTTKEFAEQSAVLAANQGLYNLFLAAGLGWSLLLGDAPHAWPIGAFFLGCVVVAGIVGGLTANPRIFLIQALPAAIALALGVVAR